MGDILFTTLSDILFEDTQDALYFDPPEFNTKILDKYLLMIYGKNKEFAYLSVSKEHLTLDTRFILYASSDEINGIKSHFKHSIPMRVGDLFQLYHKIGIDEERAQLECCLKLLNPDFINEGSGLFPVGSGDTNALSYLENQKSIYIEMLYQRILSTRDITIPQT